MQNVLQAQHVESVQILSKAISEWYDFPLTFFFGLYYKNLQQGIMCLLKILLVHVYSTS